jgi:hypothetical protein
MGVSPPEAVAYQVLVRISLPALLAVALRLSALFVAIDFHQLNCEIDTALGQRTSLVWREICAII